MEKFDASDRDRPVVVKLLRFKDKEEIMKCAKSLKGTKIFINEDFSESIRAKRKEFLPKMREESEKGNIAYLKFDRLVVHRPGTNMNSD